MAIFDKTTVFAKIGSAPMVPVFYHQELEVVEHIIQACYAGGVRAFEFTNRGDFAHEVFGEAVKFVRVQCPSMAIGAGSIVDAPTAALYMQLGAEAIKAPMPWSKLMITGGVEPTKENLTGWMKAGAFCVGMGSKLFPKDKIKEQNWNYITSKCIEALGYIVNI